MKQSQYFNFCQSVQAGKKLFSVLIDPEAFNSSLTQNLLNSIPEKTTHLFVGGSTDLHNKTQEVVINLKKHTDLPIFLFPGDYLQITGSADALLFLTLLSGRNAEYLIGQQVKAVGLIKKTNLEVISTGYILIDGGSDSSVARISKTKPISQKNIQQIVNTAIAGEYLGCKLIYLEAGSGAINPVSPDIISLVKKNISIPLIVGGGIKTQTQIQNAYNAGANMVVMGTFFEQKMQR